MALPEFAHQKREQEKAALKTLLVRALLASLALHVGLALFNFRPLWTAAEPEQEEIAIVVTEDEEPDLEEPVEEPPEELLTGDAGGGLPAPAAVALDEPIEPFIPPPQPVQPPPQPTTEPSPLATDTTETPEEPVAEPSPTASPSPPAEQPQETAVAPSPQRDLRDLLEQLRRNREAASSSETDSSPTAVGTPTQPGGTGTENGTSAGSGTGTGTGTGTSTGTGTGRESGADEGQRTAPEPARDPGEGRRIACRNCPDVDYPEEALQAGQEGTVKVLVDYDENGNVVSATLVDSSGHTVLDEAVLETVRERYRLNDTGGAGSTVLSVDMTIDGSDFNRAAQERGDRRSVDIPPPAPVADDPAPANTAAEPIAEPEPLVESPAASEDAAPVTPAAPTEVPQEAAAPSPVAPLEPAEIPQPEAPAAPVPQPEPVPEPAYAPPEPAYEAPLPEPAYVEPEPVYEEPAYVEPAYEAPAAPEVLPPAPAEPE